MEAERGGPSAAEPHRAAMSGPTIANDREKGDGPHGSIPFSFAAARRLGRRRPQNGWCQPVAMKNSIGIESIVFVRDARNATRRALFFSSSVAGLSPRIFF
jgi:hypothetical protein